MVIFLVLIASGCVTRNYDSNMDLGKSQLNEENYLEAHEAFELAYKEAKTPEARELMDLSGFLASGMKKYDEQDFDSAKRDFEEATAYKAKYREGKLMVAKAVEMHPVSDSATIEAVEGNDEMEPAEETTKDGSKVEDKAATETKGKEGSKDSVSTLSKSQAEKLVKDYVDMENFPHLHIEYDHDAEKGDYIFHVFEVDEPSQKSGHTTTWGWYGVNKKTKEVYEVM
ncbi:hypothetical protein [Peribacillus simplex]|uniref:Uncharacterized protein n=2 Tax=Peribacillus simplex TaxID=1478 RepID=A0A223EGG7_9BACI|nr:hypothetical protein [Peribacillus simplex]ASS94195.1 hypothetical protein BS1321_09635 [Peribacillus simplex NBRC 15720 = DSM 1321]MEC1397026.1 hypothetical protein [Peribacillus simplex]MED3908505.1 hypothetical protein [Peribacillus simplex]TVX80020.1 DUF309 domain-containing protein [Peribacillus simplex]